uniref:Vesicle-associated membrane protein-associated protein A n=1 Tax=Anolis carolinensis TaxID=28377 RepID=A0A803T2G9_ANOCA
LAWSYEQILVLDPPTNLKFKDPFKDVVTTNPKLRNASDRKACFKVKTTTPYQSFVSPNSGIIDPGSAVIIIVISINRRPESFIHNNCCPKNQDVVG